MLLKEKLVFEGSKEVVVDCELEWVLNFQCGSEGMKEGGGLLILFPPYLHEQSKTYVQSTRYWCDGYIEATASRQGIIMNIEIKQIDTAYIHLKNWPDSWRKVYLTVSGGNLEPSDSIIIKYGGVDRKFVPGAAAPTRAPIVASKPRGTFLRYEVFVDRTGSGEFVRFSETPSIQVKPSTPVRFKIYLPVLIKTGEEFKVRVIAEDRFRNPINYYTKEIKLLLLNAHSRAITGDIGAIVPIPGNSIKACIKEEGIYKVVIEGCEKNIPFECNPIQCSDNIEYKLFWGELHSHSNKSPNIRDNRVDITQEDCYLFAKDRSCIDFVALPEQTLSFYYHPDIDLSPDDWEEMNQTADQYHVPGEFVTFPAIELHGERGDTNIIFSKTGFPYEKKDIHCIYEVWKYYGDQGYITIPHLHRYCDPLKKKCFQETWYNGFEKKNWEKSNDQIERLVEIFSSQWGMFEHDKNEFALKAKRNVPGNTVRDFLNMGKKWGVTSGGDNHDGRPGHGGITAVYAKDCTRESIFDALFNRRCYATTGDRMMIEFNAGGGMMGEEIEMPREGRLVLSLRAIGADRISRVEIIKNGQLFYSKDCHGISERVQICDESERTECIYYYAKVIQNNGHIGWTSPVWISLC